MPEELSTALRFQHDPAYEGEYSAFPNWYAGHPPAALAGIGSGPQQEIPDELLERLGITRDKAEEVVNKVLEAENLLRELASQFHAPH